ncbi:MFS transporter [Pseudonocardia sp. S2-4]|uniref:MFS transporter n=1 Tax=Pseudonocardia humida TaxID=2800819 RepID=A0ABT1A8Q7_9PSEU|nr:MFS transporter [Pseudonocardia humida]
MPIYPLYALLFVDSGLSDLQISLLFALWSAVGVVFEVPSGVLADRFSRRGCLVAGDLVRAVGFAAWVLLPEFAGFAVGFVLWGIGSSLASGAQEALLYDGLVAAGAKEHYAVVNGRVSAAELTSQLPAAAAGTVLFSLGGYALAGWVSVGVALAAAVLAARIPEAPRVGEDDADDDEGDDLGYLATLRVGLREAAARPGVRAVLVAVMAVAAFDAVEEYFPLAVASWGVPVAWVPIVDLPIVLAGVLGAALAGLVNRLGAGAIGALLAAAMLLLGGAGLLAHPAGVAAVALFYGIYRAIVVVCDARLQDRIASRSRATVTSVAGLGTDLVSFAIYAAWVVGEVVALAVLGLLVAAVLPRLLRSRPSAPTPGSAPLPGGDVPGGG